MDSFCDTADFKCPFCLNPIADPNSGEKMWPSCHAEFEADDRGECVFADPDNLRLPISGTVCRICGLVQGEGRDSCGYCGTELSVSYH